MQRLPHAPHWQHPSRLRGEGPDAELRDWLVDEGSLTARLRAAGGTFRVRRLTQGWQRPRPDEAGLLAMRHRRAGLVREVVLELDGAPVVFARSVFPPAAVSGRLRYLRRLRERSLGEILFARKDLRRNAFELTRLPPYSDYLPAFLRSAERPWARRSVFELGPAQVLVSEVFLCPLPSVQRSGGRRYRFQRASA